MNKKPSLALLLPLLLLLAGAAAVQAQPEAPPTPAEVERAAYIRANYTKFEYRIPMRDGARLFTCAYVPNELSGQTFPILMVRTPYSVSPYGLDRYKEKLGPSADFEKEKFIFVFQDVRGRYMSEGEFVDMRPHKAGKGPKEVDESSDTWDTVDWLVKNLPRNNGKAGAWGISYPGFYAAMTAIDAHPALKAVSPQAPIADWFWDDMHRNGAFNLNLAFAFFSGFGKKRPEPTTEEAEGFEWKQQDGYQFFLDLGPVKNVQSEHFKGEIPFWNDIVAHPNYDEYWQSRNILPHLRKIKPATMIVGGLFDMEDLYGPMKIYREIEKNNGGNWNTLVLGPWRHGGWVRTEGEKLGTADFGFKTAEFYRDQVDLAFFKHFLKGGAKPELPEALVFETGANRWRSFDAWPPKEAKARKLYFGEGGKLSFEPPKEAGEDSYPSDPQKPVPYTAAIGHRWNPEYMTEDQRFAAWRPDVLVYKTEVLKEDLTLAGPLRADLWVRTTGEDADFVVKLVDVYPGEHPDAETDETKAALGGQQMLVRGEVLRGRFRDSVSAPKPFVPGEATKVGFELQDVLHTFQRGHRIMIQVQSSWFPLIDRNPQKWVPNIFEANEEDFVKATHTVVRGPQQPSGVEVGVLP
jgi:putative CocE/NonD family hydrolase